MKIRKGFLIHALFWLATSILALNVFLPIHPYVVLLPLLVCFYFMIVAKPPPFSELPTISEHVEPEEGKTKKPVRTKDEVLRDVQDFMGRIASYDIQNTSSGHQQASKIFRDEAPGLAEEIDKILEESKEN